MDSRMGLQDFSVLLFILISLLAAQIAILSHDHDHDQQEEIAYNADCDICLKKGSNNSFLLTVNNFYNKGWSAIELGHLTLIEVVGESPTARSRAPPLS
ncbi:MAG: hypothetical protein ISR27_03830 [Pseudomonadales bacterium]|nr:hypothetical protein [Pseudomonadales bacterium]